MVMDRPFTKGGQSAEGLILRLRSRTWFKAGRDPDPTLPRVQVVKYAEEELKKSMQTILSNSPGNSSPSETLGAGPHRLSP
jgi:hypothetical protein